MKRNKLIVGIGLLLIGIFAFYGFAIAQDEYELEWAVDSAGGTMFNFPRDVTVDSAGDVYVADTNNARILKLSKDTGDLVGAPWVDSEIVEPYGVAVDTLSNIIYVADGNDHDIDKIGSTISKLYYNGLMFPHGIEVGSDGNVYVTDTGGSGLVRKIIATTGNEGPSPFDDTKYGKPRDIAFDSAGNAYVVDASGAHYIHMFGNDGAPLATWESFGEGDSFYEPDRIAVDSEGYVYVTDMKDASMADHRILKFSVNKNVDPPTLNLEMTLQSWATTTGTDSLLFPTGIAVDSYGNLYVADSGHHRILKFAPLSLCDPVGDLGDLINIIAGFNLKQGIENNLDAKLENAIAAISAANAGQRQDAVNKLEAFKNAVEAQSGNALTEEQADILIDNANLIIQCLQE